MKTTIEFLKAVKQKHNIPSDGKLALILGHTRSSVSLLLQGRNFLGDEAAMKVADLLDLDPAYVVACVHAERAKHAKEKQLWERIATLTAGIAAALLVIAILPTAQLPTGEFNAAFSAELPDSVYYVKL